MSGLLAELSPSGEKAGRQPQGPLDVLKKCLRQNT